MTIVKSGLVTFTNSAVENFRSRIGNLLRQRQGLLPGVGYRVRTLHGLAHDIVRERPALVGLSERFDIVDERTANEIKRESVLAYLRTHPDLFSPYLHPDFLQNFRRIERYVLEDALDIANLVIVGKELRVEPYALQAGACASNPVRGRCWTLVCTSMPTTNAVSLYVVPSILMI